MSVVAVFGATGQTGARVVERLVAAGRDVIAVSRRGGRVSGATRAASADLATASVDELAALLDGVDAVVFAAAGDPIRVDRDGALRVVDAAERAGVDRFVLVTGMGVGRDRPAEYYGGFWGTYFGAKEASEHGLRASSLRWTILQPGELLNSRGQGRVQLAPTGALPIGAVTRDDVARVAVAALDDDRAAGHTWELVQGTRSVEDEIERMAEAAHARRR